MASRKRTIERRQRALARAVEIGDQAAADEADCTVQTLRRWRGDEPEPEPGPTPPTDNEPDDSDAPELPDTLDGDIERMRRAARSARRVAQAAINQTDRMVDAGRASDARNAAAAAGILLDKALKLDEAILAAGVERQRIDETQAQQLASVITAICDVTGVDLANTDVRNAVRSLLTAGGSDGALAEAVSAQDRQRVRAAVRDGFRGELRAELLAEFEAERKPTRHEQRQLPAPRPTHPDGQAAERAEDDEMAAPVRRVRALRDRRDKRAQNGSEHVTGEVVDDKPKRNGWRPDGERRKRSFTIGTDPSGYPTFREHD